MGNCRIPRPQDPEAAARAEVVEFLFAYVERLRAHFESIAAGHDLTPTQAKVILALGEPAPMKGVAESMNCDPSNVTGVVDRLEERGLLTRSETPEDRRVKILHPTAAGKRLQETLLTRLFRDVPGMEGLNPAQVADLRDALAALCGQYEPAPDGR